METKAAATAVARGGGAPAKAGGRAPARGRPGLTLLAVALGVMMVALDGTIVAVANPAIQEHLNASLAGIQWVTNAYLLALAVSLMTMGKLGDRFGHKRVFMTGVTGFALSSAAIGLSGTIASSLGLTTAAPAELENEEVPLVIDASGNPDAPAMALDLLAHEGTLLVASWFGTKPVVLPLGGAFHRRRLTIRSTQVSTVPARLSGTWSRSRRRQETVELLGELPLAQLCTHVFGFGAAADAFRAVDQGKPGLMHAVLNYDRSAAGDL